MSGICDRMNLGNLQERPKCATAKTAMTSRLQDAKAEDKAAKLAEAAFIAEVRTRDKWICRCCGRKVIKTLALVGNRAEVHHVHGRIGKLRYLVRCALLLCSSCHEKVTGTVGANRLHVVGTKFFKLEDGQTLIDARRKVTFEVVK